MPKKQQPKLIAGVDEAGRGPLAGPVVAAAVILDPKKKIKGLMDSKQLTEKERERFYKHIMKKALAVGVGRASVEEIDRFNILQATFMAMQRAVQALLLKPELVLIDGNRSPKLIYETQTIIKGDETEPSISAASIIAKVTRDREMMELCSQYPEYGFSRHKGYSTPEHLSALKQHGPCGIHRQSFAPVEEWLNENNGPLEENLELVF